MTLIDGFVYSWTARYQSVNYRSAVCFDCGVQANQARRRQVLDALIPRYFPGRTAGEDFEPMPNAHVNATDVIVMTTEDATAKVRRGGPKGPHDDDPQALSSAGVVELPSVELPFPR
ncbi:MAG TPA: hypothetical protein VGQ52_16815 [Gemmatimonadaceae bacterium]|nr:hypothetical protein [Gemmatimonadaceae bacterium]